MNCHLNLSRLGWCPRYLISTVLSKKRTMSLVRWISSTGTEPFLSFLSAGFIRIDPFIPKWTLKGVGMNGREKKRQHVSMHTRLDNKRTERKPGSGRLNYVLKKCHNLHPSRHCAGQDCYSKQQHNICSLTYSYHKSRLHTQTRKIPQNRMGYFIQHVVLSTIRSRQIWVQQTEFIDSDNNYKLAKDHYIYL